MKENLNLRKHDNARFKIKRLNLKSSKGITLVALVVTVVVLLILAGVTITTLLGNNGIINKSQHGVNAVNTIQSETMQELQNLVNELANDLGENDGSGGTTPVEPAGISFTIYKEGTSETINCQASAGMTWESWIASDFNNVGLIIVSGEIYLGNRRLGPLAPEQKPVVPSDIINPELEYRIHVDSNILYKQPKMFTFTILDTKDNSTLNCEAAEGMTWGEWIESLYNKYDFAENSGYIYRGGPGNGAVPSWTMVTPEDVISTELEYSIDTDCRALCDRF